MKREDIENRIKELRTPRYGHGAFGERERYDPSKADLLTALMLENLLLGNDYLQKKVNDLEKQIDEHNHHEMYFQHES